jgi:hypothetical protein
MLLCVLLDEQTWMRYGLVKNREHWRVTWESTTELWSIEFGTLQKQRAYYSSYVHSLAVGLGMAMLASSLLTVLRTQCGWSDSCLDVTREWVTKRSWPSSRRLRAWPFGRHGSNLAAFTRITLGLGNYCFLFRLMNAAFLCWHSSAIRLDLLLWEFLAGNIMSITLPFYPKNLESSGAFGD